MTGLGAARQGLVRQVVIGKELNGEARKRKAGADQLGMAMRCDALQVRCGDYGMAQR